MGGRGSAEDAGGERVASSPEATGGAGCYEKSDGATRRPLERSEELVNGGGGEPAAEGKVERRK